jgi:hypothetical protein
MEKMSNNANAVKDFLSAAMGMPSEVVLPIPLSVAKNLSYAVLDNLLLYTSTK